MTCSSTRRAGTVVAFAVSWLLFADSTPAAACDCASRSTEVYLDDADAVYIGLVRAIRTGPRFPQPEIEFAVYGRLKGEVRRRRFLLHATPARGTDCEGFDFSMGQTYLVFAATRHSLTGKPGSYGVSWCDGTIALNSVEGRNRLREARGLVRRR